jgi:hypothetical protein
MPAMVGGLGAVVMNANGSESSSSPTRCRLGVARDDASHCA